MGCSDVHRNEKDEGLGSPECSYELLYQEGKGKERRTGYQRRIQEGTTCHQGGRRERITFHQGGSEGRTTCKDLVRRCSGYLSSCEGRGTYKWRLRPILQHCCRQGMHDKSPVALAAMVDAARHIALYLKERAM